MTLVEPRVRRPAGVDAAACLVSNLASLLLTAVTGIVIARALGPAGKGTVSLVVLVATQLAWSFSLGIELSLLHYGGEPTSSLKRLASACLPIALPLSGAATFAAIGLLHFPLSNSVPAPVRPIVYIGMGTVPVLFVAGYLNALLRASGRIVEAQVSTGWLALSGLTTALVGAGFGFGLPGFLAMAVLGILIGTMPPYFFAWRAGILPPARLHDRELQGSLVRYGLKGHLGTILQGLNYRLDVFLVAALLSAGEVGLYTVAVAAAEALWIVPNVLGFVIVHRAALHGGQGAAGVTAAATRLTAAALFVGALVLLLVGQRAIPFAFGNEFRRSYDALVFLLPGVWALGIWKNLTNDLVGRGYPWVRSQTAAAAVVLTVVLDLSLIPHLGITGAALASSCAYSAAMVLALRKYARIAQTSWAQLLVPKISDVAIIRSAVQNATAHLRGTPPR